jgi:DNA-binding PadR family transcriptional regulator
MTSDRQPSITTHALLGLLALRPWTAYELTAQMRRALRYAWPRTEANLYNEIKQLSSRGLAHASEEESGGRTRTRYEITDVGREAVAAWLRTEPTPVQVQFETLLRVFLADQGNRDELLAAIRATREQTIAAVAEVLPIAEDYAGDTPPFPDRAHLNGLFIAFIADFLHLVLDWCDSAEREIATWPAAAGVGHTDGTRRMVDRAVAYYRSVLKGKKRHP